MSIEIRGGWPCPHLIMEEPVQLQADGVTLELRSPVGGAASVHILANDSLYIPPEGLWSPAILLAGQPGPYRIRPCLGELGPDEDLLEIATPEGVFEVRIPQGDRVTPEEVLRTLRLSPLREKVSFSVEDGRLRLEETSRLGPSSFLRLSGPGARNLGFLQRGARGRQVYPGWALISLRQLPNSFNLHEIPFRYPRFNSPLQGAPTLKVTYTTIPAQCSRCQGTWVENDWRFDPVGEVVQIEGEELLHQACLKAILTVRGSNQRHPRYGSQVLSRIGGKAVGAVASQIREDIAATLQQVQQLQRKQSQYQPVSARETLRTIEAIEVLPDAEDPTVFRVSVTVRTASSQPVQINTVFTVPGAVALAGSNGQTLGTEAVGLGRSRS